MASKNDYNYYSLFFQRQYTHEHRQLIENAWAAIKSKYSEKLPKIKQQFIIDMSMRLFDFATEYCQYMGAPKALINVTDVVEYVFAYHYFFTGRLPDAERSKTQRSEEYKETFFNKMCNVIFNDINTLTPVSITSKYEPEISSCIFLCDSIYRLINDMNIFGICKVNFIPLSSLVRTLFNNSIGFMKTILSQLINSFPYNAVVSLRSLLELEHTICVLLKHPELVGRYTHFSFFEFADADGAEEIHQILCNYASEDGYDPNHSGYRHYGWIYGVDEYKGLAPTLKTLFRIADNESRYRAFSEASGFTHTNLNSMQSDPIKIYDFIIEQINKSLINLTNSIAKLLETCGIPYETAKDEVTFDNYTARISDYTAIRDQYRKNRIHDKSGN